MPRDEANRIGVKDAQRDHIKVRECPQHTARDQGSATMPGRSDHRRHGAAESDLCQGVH